MGFQHNPVTHRIDLLRHKWKVALEKNKYCRIIRWYAKADESEMIDAFIELEASEHGELPDIFLRLESVFPDSEHFSMILIRELEDRLTNEKEALKELGISVNWTPITDEKKNKDKEHTLLFLNNLKAFIKALPAFEDRLLVIHLSPAEIQNPREWNKWIHNLIEVGIPEQIRFVLTEVVGYSLYGALSERFPETVIAISPDLGMDEVMRQTAAAAGNPNAPDVQFRNYFLCMSEAAGKQDLPAAERWGVKALAIAQKAMWFSMEVAVLMQLGNLALTNKDYERCMTHYNQAVTISKQAYDNGDVTGGTLLAQAHAARAAAFYCQEDYDLAVSDYKAMSTIATEINNHFYGMEGWRMAAYCSRKMDDYESAWESNWKALDIARYLDEPIRKNSTIPFIGKELLELSSNVGKTSERRHIHETMEQLVGADWESKLIGKQAVNHVSS